MSDPIAREEVKALDVKVVPNPVLTRLIEEIRHEGAEVPLAYNRQHNRHNR